MRRAAVAVVLVLLAGCGGSSKPAAVTHRTLTMNGTLTLPSDGWQRDGQGGCVGGGGYSDITAGAGVTVKDPHGTIVGAGTLNSGATEDVGVLDTRCLFGFSVPRLPVDAFYSVEVTHRGPVTFTLAQVRSMNVDLTLGS